MLHQMRLFFEAKIHLADSFSGSFYVLDHVLEFLVDRLFYSFRLLRLGLGDVLNMVFRVLYYYLF